MHKNTWIIVIGLILLGLGIWGIASTPGHQEPQVAPPPAEINPGQSETPTKIPIKKPDPVALAPEWQVRRMLTAEKTPHLTELLLEITKDGAIDVNEVRTQWQPAQVKIQVQKCSEIWASVKLEMAAAKDPLEAGLKEAAKRGIAGAVTSGTFSSQPVKAENLDDEDWTKSVCEQMVVDAIRDPGLIPNLEGIIMDGEITGEEYQNYSQTKELLVQQKLIKAWRDSLP